MKREFEGFKDYYEILGVSKLATMAEIKKAYRKIALKYHPDALPKEISEEDKKECIEKFQAATEAKEVLSNIVERRKYDDKYEAYYRQKKEEEKKAQQKQQSTNNSHGTSHQEKTKGEQSTRNNMNKETKNTKENTFAESVRAEYKDVKSKERKASFRKRHGRITYNFCRKHSKKNITIPEMIALSLGLGVVHVTEEFLYQIKKMIPVTDDTGVRYVLRNRKLLSALVAATVICNVAGNYNNDAQPIDKEPISETTQETSSNLTEWNDTVADIIAKTSYDDTTKLNRNHLVLEGDTLSELAYNSGTSVENIQEINGLSSDIIKTGENLIVPYIIDNKNLQFYTLLVPTEGRNIYEIADEFNTDPETICNLNKESIEEINGYYFILSDRVFVPKFITRDELANIQEVGKQYTR